MKITLDEADIKTAVETYIRTQINIPPTAELVIEYKAGRGENGLSANVDIINDRKPSTPISSARSIAYSSSEEPSSDDNESEDTAEPENPIGKKLINKPKRISFSKPTKYVEEDEPEESDSEQETEVLAKPSASSSLFLIKS